LLAYVEQFWEQDALPTLQKYVRLEALSPDFDKDWETVGSLGAAAELLSAWCANQRIPGATVEVLKAATRTPMVLVDVSPGGPAPSEETVLLYGHYDKQPPFLGWRPGLDPYKAHREGDLIYGRGASDDGYAVFAIVGAIKGLEAAGGSHGRLVVLVEGSKESGSRHLAAYLDELAERIGEPSLVIALDSSCVS
jgi:acetylornithine deacetylase/succinyl-diaminopimelate desuccinylase-like protein